MEINLDVLTEAELIDLNHKIVERLRLIRQMHAHKEMFKFKLGDKVTFHPEGRSKQYGTLTRFNKKTVTVITEDGMRWNVAPQLIHRQEESHKNGSPVLKLVPENNSNSEKPLVGRNKPCPCGSGRKFKKCCA